MMFVGQHFGHIDRSHGPDNLFLSTVHLVLTVTCINLPAECDRCNAIHSEACGVFHIIRASLVTVLTDTGPFRTLERKVVN